jgi:hypothetical protein
VCQKPITIIVALEVGEKMEKFRREISGHINQNKNRSQKSKAGSESGEPLGEGR